MFWRRMTQAWTYCIHTHRYTLCKYEMKNRYTHVIDLTWSKQILYNNCLDRKVFHRHKVLFNVFLPLQRISFKSLPKYQSIIAHNSNACTTMYCIVTYNNYIAKTTGNRPLEIDCFCETCKRKNTSTFSVDKFRKILLC